MVHWSDHKVICKSGLLKSNWRPCWEREGHTPAFATPQQARNLHNPFGETKYLWGNVPAVDVINLEHNEGRGFTGNFSVLFAGELCGRLLWFSVISAHTLKRLVIFAMWSRHFQASPKSTVAILESL